MSRTRYAYTLGGVPLPTPIEVSADFRGEGAERQPVFTDRHLEGMRAPDGTDIGCRWKRDEYMRRNGVTDASDYTQTWCKAQQQRVEWRMGQAATSRDTINEVGRAAYEARRGGKR